MVSIDELDDEYPTLPAEAGSYTALGFEPSDDWLLSAQPDLRHAAMRHWFLSHYCDPAYETPYNSEEGGYIYVYGGPYQAEDEIHGRFGRLFDDEILQSVIDDVESSGIDEWAPSQIEPDYDDYFVYEPESEALPFDQFHQRLSMIDSLNSIELDNDHRNLLHQLLYTHLITSLEAYLSDTMSYWIESNDEVFKRYVAHCPDFKRGKISLSSVFERI